MSMTPTGRRIRHRPSATVILAMTVGCADLLGPGAPSVSMPGALGVDPVVIGASVFECDRIPHDFPTNDGWVLLDLYFGRRSLDDPVDAPRAEHLRQLRNGGAWLLHVFRFPAVRAVVPLSLVREMRLPDARAVPYSDRFDVPAFVGVDDGTLPEWTATIEAHGGRVTRTSPYSPFLSADLPDGRVAAVRAAPGVEYVELDTGPACARNPTAPR